MATHFHAALWQAEYSNGRQWGNLAALGRLVYDPEEPDIRLLDRRETKRGHGLRLTHQRDLLAGARRQLAGALRSAVLGTQRGRFDPHSQDEETAEHVLHEKALRASVLDSSARDSSVVPSAGTAGNHASVERLA
jgi:hypothetical protein